MHGALEVLFSLTDPNTITKACHFLPNQNDEVSDSGHSLPMVRRSKQYWKWQLCYHSWSRQSWLMVAHEVVYVIAIVSLNEKKTFFIAVRAWKTLQSRENNWFTFLLLLLLHRSWNGNKNSIFSQLNLITCSISKNNSNFLISQKLHILCNIGIDFFGKTRNW